MTMRPALVLVLASALAAFVGADEAVPPAPLEFKWTVEFYGVQKEPARRAELVARKGRAYWLLSDTNEVIVYEPDAGQVELVDLERMERTDVSLKKLDDALARWRNAKLAATDRLRDAGGRANALSAAMGRDLIDPQFMASFDAAQSRLTLTNASVTVEALGEPEPDAARRAFTAEALAAMLKLDTIREPKALPPFAALDALRRLTREHALRPFEITFVYRLNGPPRKERWLYKLQLVLSEREGAAIAKIDAARGRAKSLRFDRYELE
jgi:hypothetical protein